MKMKPLKLLLNFKLWGKLISLSTPNKKYVYAILHPYDEDLYSGIYSKDGDLILDKNFKVVGCYQDYMSIVTVDPISDSEDEKYEFIVVDITLGKICTRYGIESPDISPWYIDDDIKYCGVTILAYKCNNKYTFFTPSGFTIYKSSTMYKVLGDKLLFDTADGVCVISKYTQAVFDFVAFTKKKDVEQMLLLGKIVNGEMIYTAMGSKGYPACQTYFKGFYEEDDGIVVKLCDADGNDLDTLAFISRENGKVTKFDGAYSLSSFKYGCLFVTMKGNSEEPMRTYLSTYDNKKIATYKKAIEDFREIYYGEFKKILAIVENEEGKVVYIDTSAREYPIPDSNDYLDMDNIAYRFRKFVNPINLPFYDEV